MRAFRILGVIVALSLTMAAPLAAQAVQDVPEIKPDDVTDGQVVSFVNAMIAVQRVRSEYSTKVEAAENDDDRQAVIAEAGDAAMAAVEEIVGITAVEYVAINLAAQDSEELTERINSRIRELREKQSLSLQGGQEPAEGQAE